MDGNVEVVGDEPGEDQDEKKSSVRLREGTLSIRRLTLEMRWEKEGDGEGSRDEEGDEVKEGRGPRAEAR